MNIRTNRLGTVAALAVAFTLPATLANADSDPTPPPGTPAPQTLPSATPATAPFRWNEAKHSSKTPWE